MSERPRRLPTAVIATSALEAHPFATNRRNGWQQIAALDYRANPESGTEIFVQLWDVEEGEASLECGPNHTHRYSGRASGT